MASKWSELWARLRGQGQTAGEPQTPPQEAPPTPPAPPEEERAGTHDMQSVQPSGNPGTAGREERQALSSHPVKDNGSSRVGGQTDRVSRVYAQALLEMADAQGKADEIGEELAQIGALAAAQPQLRALLTTPTIAAAERAGVVERLFRGRVSDTTYKFLQVVNNKGRLSDLEGIIHAYRALLDEKHGVVHVEVRVPQPLDAGEIEGVAQRIGSALNRRVVLRQEVQPGLIGGIVVRVGDQLIDGSVATQLRAMRKRLVEAGRERARQQAQSV